jgi:hypothetical protein
MLKYLLIVFYLNGDFLKVTSCDIRVIFYCASDEQKRKISWYNAGWMPCLDDISSPIEWEMRHVLYKYV